MIKTLLLFVVLSLTTACSNVPNHPHLIEGEHLITPFFEDVTDWEIQEQQDHRFSSRVWLQPLTGMASAYSVTVFYMDTSTLASKRELIDSPGLEGCDVFNSASLTFPNSEYKSEYWETSCENANGTRAQILHLMFRGKDDIYHLQKSWQGEVPRDSIAQWKAKFETVYICENKTKISPCPSI